MNQVSARPRFSWPLFWTLFTAAIIGIVGMVPAGMDIFRSALVRTELPAIPLPILITIGVIQNLALLGLFVGVGLRVAAKVGLGAKVTQSWLNGELVPDHVWSVLRFGVLAGVLVGALLIPIFLSLAQHLPNLPFVTAARIPIWKRFLLCFYGGLYEEILSRLFLLSFFAWLMNKSWRKNAEPLSNGVFWSANLIVAVLFGLGHLPSASLVMPITTLVVAAALVLNGFAALVFGWLYRRRGLEAAMIAHFTADFMLYVIGPHFLVG